jgi:hypothetical protein
MFLIGCYIVPSGYCDFLRYYCTVLPTVCGSELYPVNYGMRHFPLEIFLTLFVGLTVRKKIQIDELKLCEIHYIIEVCLLIDLCAEHD